MQIETWPDVERVLAAIGMPAREFCFRANVHETTMRKGLARRSRLSGPMRQMAGVVIREYQQKEASA